MSNSQVYPIINFPNLYINGFQITYATTTTLTIGAGQARDSNNVMDLILNTSSEVPSPYVSAPLTLNINNVGVNGLDSGSGVPAAFGTYDIYIIGSSSNDKPIACVGTASVNTAPIMPFGYDSLRYLGTFSTNGSSLLTLGYWTGTSNVRKFFYDVPLATSITAGASTTYTPVTGLIGIPLHFNTVVNFQTNFNAAAAGNTLNLQGATSVGDSVLIIAPVAGATAHTVTVSEVIAQSSGINYKVSAGAVAVNVASYSYSL